MTYKLSTFIQNYPLKLNFAGLVGNTLSMQEQGWEFAVRDTGPRFRGVEQYIAGRHRGYQLYLMSETVTIDINQLAYLESLTINVRACAEQMILHVNMPASTSFMPVDFSEPTVHFQDRIESKQMTFEDYMPFKPTNSEAELFIPEKEIWTVEKELRRIVEAQRPIQKELREKKRNNEIKEMRVRGQEQSFSDQKKDVKLKLISVV